METDTGLPELDVRYLADRHGDAVYTLPAYDTLADWEARAQWLRRHLACVQGLWPLPERTPLNAPVLVDSLRPFVMGVPSDISRVRNQLSEISCQTNSINTACPPKVV